jgi:hypothetical protein
MFLAASRRFMNRFDAPMTSLMSHRVKSVLEEQKKRRERGEIIPGGNFMHFDLILTFCDALAMSHRL